MIEILATLVAGFTILILIDIFSYGISVKFSEPPRSSQLVGVIICALLSIGLAMLSKVI